MDKGKYIYIIEFNDGVTKEAFLSLVDVFRYHSGNEVGTDLKTLYSKQNWKIDVKTDKCTIKRYLLKKRG